MNGEHEPDRETRVREAAYFMWESEGRPDGEADRHWAAAEKLVDSEIDAPRTGNGDARDREATGARPAGS